MRKLGRAAAERQCSHAADGAGVTVRHRMRRARQHHAELRRDDVRNALLRIVQIENLDPVPGAALAHRLEKGRARRIGVVVAARLGGDGMVHRRERQIGPPHRPVLFLQLFERVRRVQLVQHVTIDVDQLAAIGAPRDQMIVPDFLEQGLGHGAPPQWAAILVACPREGKHAGAAAAQRLGLVFHRRNHDDAPPPDHAPHADARRRCDRRIRSDAGAGAERGQLARPCGANGHSLSGRRLDRRAVPHYRRTAQGQARPILRRREQARRLRQHRHRPDREGPAGRLRHRRRDGRAFLDQPVPDRQDAVRRGEGPRRAVAGL